MVTLLNSKRRKKATAMYKDDFEKYLDKQRACTTFNGIEVSCFSAYKKLMGLK